MRKYAVSAIIGLCFVTQSLVMAEVPDTFEGKLSYSMGFEVGTYFKMQDGDIKKEQLIAGIEDAYKGAEAALSAEEMLAVKQEYAQKMQQKQMAELEKMMAANLAAGQAYLEENKKKEGVIVTDSGLQYEILQEGKGEKAGAEDTVTVDYTGTLIDGTEFDSTIKRGQPAEFAVNQVIPGWSEALQLMSPGTKLRLAIPSELAYGEQGAPPRIQPNSVLLFEVELHEVKKPAAE